MLLGKKWEIHAFGYSATVIAIKRAATDMRKDIQIHVQVPQMMQEVKKRSINRINESY